MPEYVHEIGEVHHIEKRDGGFMKVVVSPPDILGMMIVRCYDDILTRKGLPDASELPVSANCANCTNPALNPDNCPRKPNEDHFIVGFPPNHYLDILAQQKKHVCPAHSSGE